MQEFGYYILFGGCRKERNHSETTKDNETYFQEHNLQLSNEILLHHAISVISMASEMAEADYGPLTREIRARYEKEAYYHRHHKEYFRYS